MAVRCRSCLILSAGRPRCTRASAGSLLLLLFWPSSVRRWFRDRPLPRQSRQPSRLRRRRRLPDQPPAAEPRGDSPGLINEIGKLWDKSSSMLPSLLPAGEAPAANPPEPAAPQSPPPEARRPPPLVAAPPAVEPPPPPASTALVPSIVSGKVQCPTAANGAPDCKVGADLLCQSKGYGSGKSLSSDSVEACSAKRLIPGRERKPDDCHTNYFVTRAFCQ